MSPPELNNQLTKEITFSELRQGTVVDSEQLDSGVRKQIQDSRAITRYRSKQVAAQLIVLSQDCDIANPNEKVIEVIPAKLLNENQAQKGLERTFDKPTNYGKLVLRFNGQYFELDADLISTVEKSLLPDSLHSLGSVDEREHRILIDWRVGRYNRKPFPDAFNRPFKEFFKKEGLWDFLEQRYREILDLWVYVSPEDEEKAQRYDVSITAEIDQGCTDQVHDEVRERLYAALQKLHDKTAEDSQCATLNFGQISGIWSSGLPGCTVELTAFSEDISLADIQFLRTYNTAFVCYPD